MPLTEEVQLATREVLTKHPKLLGVGGGRNGADPFVMGLACLQGGVVVTEELISRNLSKPRIPDVCDDLGVQRLTLVGFVQAQGWTF